MFSPHYFSKRPIIKKIHYALDNGCFMEYKNGDPWYEKLFYKTVKYVSESEFVPDFVTVPDVVAKKKLSIIRSKEHITKIPENLTKYFVVQDKMTVDDVSWFLDKVDGLFIGGSIKWKWRAAPYWKKVSTDHGLKFHIGRVGTVKRLLDSYYIGADSVDGSGMTRNRKTHYVHIFRKTIREQKRLLEPKETQI